MLLTFDVLTIDRSLPPFFDSGFDVVCRNNLQETLMRWQSQDFRAALTPCEDL